MTSIKYLYTFFLLVIFIISPQMNAQDLPPVISFPPAEYLSDNQNWSITQDENELIYVANNKGLMVYNGERWQLYKSPNQSIIRSVYAINDRIYTGCFREFGYWEYDEFGQLNYESISKNIDIEIEANEEFWTIVQQEDWLIFQSLDNLYLYHRKNKEVRKISIEGEITKVFLVDNEIYFSQPNKGIFTIKNTQIQLLSDALVFTENQVLNIYKDGNELLVQTDKRGIFHLDESTKPWKKDASGSLANFTVYNSLQTKKGDLILGTISQGVVFVSLDTGEINYHITKDQTLRNNTVLSLFEDNLQNIWLGLDHGIDCVNLNSPVRIYQDKSGLLGTVYTSLVFEDILYLGTNQGLFAKKLDSNDDFRFIEGTAGQVWSLFEHQETLFCGHNNGVFEVNNFGIEQVTPKPTWVLRSFPERDDLLLLGNYNGISVLKKENNKWSFSHTIEGFDLSARYLEFLDSNTFLVSHEYQGVYEVSLNSEFKKVTKVNEIKNAQRGLYSSLASFEGAIYYAFEKGVYKYDATEKKFIKNDFLSYPYEEEGYSSGRLISQKNKRVLWLFTAQGIHQFIPNDLDQSLIQFTIPINSSMRNTMLGYESISSIEGEKYLLGNAEGYYIFDLMKIKELKFSFNTSISTVSNWSISERKNFLSKFEKPSLDSKHNNLNFEFYVPNYGKFLRTEYQYRLIGLFDEWSEWRSEPEASFYNLDFGNYTLEVRSKIGGQLSANVVSYPFTIERPFFLSNLMLVVYVIVFLLIVSTVHTIYNTNYKKQKRKLKEENKKEIELRDLESQRKLMRIKNEQLQSDIDSKNRELAISTMSLIKKNEFLNSIKDELNKEKERSAGVKRVIRIIDKNINNNDDWKFFEEAFNNADKDFLKKIKEKHPSLTPNDLRLCAYLRLNLSSKEIAPLFNISLKSVEVKRYRLRKKMDLPREESLTNYILEI